MKRKWSKWTDRQLLELRDLAIKGGSLRVAGEGYGITREAVRQLLEVADQRGLIEYVSPRDARFIKVIVSEQGEMVRSMAKGGASVSRIGRECGLTGHFVRRILSHGDT